MQEIMEKNDKSVAELLSLLVQKISETSAEVAIQKFSRLEKASIPKTLWNKKQTFKFLNISHETGNHWIELGYLKPLVFGDGRMKFDPDEIMKSARELKTHKYERQSQ